MDRALAAESEARRLREGIEALAQRLDANATDADEVLADAEAKRAWVTAGISNAESRMGRSISAALRALLAEKGGAER
jgi:hypothetical protein